MARYHWSNFNQLLKDYAASGRTVQHFPRLHLVSISGGPRLPIREAVARMLDTLNSVQPLRPEGPAETKGEG